jgi:hypothetical protein
MDYFDMEKRIKIMKMWRDGETIPTIAAEFRKERKTYQLTSREFKDWIREIIGALIGSDLDPGYMPNSQNFIYRKETPCKGTVTK